GLESVWPGLEPVGLECRRGELAIGEDELVVERLRALVGRLFGGRDLDLPLCAIHALRKNGGVGNRKNAGEPQGAGSSHERTLPAHTGSRQAYDLVAAARSPANRARSNPHPRRAQSLCYGTRPGAAFSQESSYGLRTRDT